MPTQQEAEELADKIANGASAWGSLTALALATVDLSIAVRDGQTNNLSRAQIRKLFRDRVVEYIMQNGV